MCFNYPTLEHITVIINTIISQLQKYWVFMRQRSSSSSDPFLAAVLLLSTVNGISLLINLPMYASTMLSSPMSFSWVVKNYVKVLIDQLKLWFLQAMSHISKCLHCIWVTKGSKASFQTFYVQHYSVAVCGKTVSALLKLISYCPAFVAVLVGLLLGSCSF